MLKCALKECEEKPESTGVMGTGWEENGKRRWEEGIYTHMAMENGSDGELGWIPSIDGSE